MEKLHVEITGDASGLVKSTDRARDALGRFVASSDRAAAATNRNRDALGRFVAGAKGSTGGIAGITRSFEGLGDTLASFGSRLTVGFTIPFSLLSGAAFKAYGDIDALRLGLENIEGSTAGAAARFGELREVAKLPGLGLSEAIKGDTRLRALGFSAIESKNALLQFGNALALTGGGKTELDNVLTQLTQMASKSSVLTEDLKPIINAGPAIAAAVKKIFGTVNAEEISDKLKAAGKGPKDFVNELVAELSKLERIKSGPKNAIENFGDNVKIASYEFMKAADSSLGLTSKLEGLGNMIGSVATGFSTLPGFVQGSIFVVTGLAASFGPLILAVGSFIQLMPTLQAGLRAIQGGMAALTSPMGLLTLGAAAAAVALGTLIYSVWKYNEALDASVDKSRLQASVNAQVEQSIGSERARLESLLKVARDENLTKDARAKAIKEINDISPRYLGNLNLETIGTQNATKAINEYVRAMTLRARQTALFNTIQEKQAQLAAEKAKTPEATAIDVIGTFVMGNVNEGGLMDQANEKATYRQVTAINTLINEIDVLTKEAETATAQLAKMGEGGTSGAGGGFMGSMTNALEDARVKLKKLGDEIALDKFNKVATPAAKLAEYTELKKKIEEADAALKSPKKGTAKTISDYWEDELKLVEQKIADFKARNVGVQVLPGFLTARKDEVLNRLGKLEKTDLPSSTEIGPVKSAAQRYWEAISKGWMTEGQRAFEAKRNDFNKILSSLWEASDRAGAQGQDQKRAAGRYNNINAAIDRFGSMADLKRSVNQLVEGGSIGQGVVDGLGLDQVDEAVNKGQISLANLRGFSDSFQAVLRAFSDGVRELSIDVGASIIESLGRAIGGGKNVMQGLLQSVASMLAQFLVQTGKLLIKAASFLLLGGTTNPILFAAGLKQAGIGAAMIAGAGVVTALAAKVPAMGNSGLAYGPTLTMIGDNPNARFDPEMVAPASDITSMIRAAASGGGNGGGRVEFEIRGSSLIGVLREANAAQYNNR
ncbi:tape measure protein [Larkinella terrae]|uniref:Tape measure protein n=1 Tax=Larkinella terrae TaxID=2025311 RepID=A0A7K0EJ00_9BACT|nr:tape measure protein [Larkinella terrae]MRS61787.1 tape measure protein [Larkinella terrae]